MSTFFYTWRASDAARNFDLLLMAGGIAAQFGFYPLLARLDLPINKDLAQKIYIVAVVIIDLVSALWTGVQGMR